MAVSGRETKTDRDERPVLDARTLPKPHRCSGGSNGFAKRKARAPTKSGTSVDHSRSRVQKQIAPFGRRSTLTPATNSYCCGPAFQSERPLLSRSYRGYKLVIALAVAVVFGPRSFWKHDAVLVDQKGHDSRVAILRRIGDKSKPARHVSIDEVVLGAARRVRALRLQRVEEIAVERLRLRRPVRRIPARWRALPAVQSGFPARLRRPSRTGRFVCLRR